jgi:hypothetical protein
MSLSGEIYDFNTLNFNETIYNDLIKEAGTMVKS